MAFDYTTTNTGVFYRLGRIIKAVNDHLANATTTLPAQLANIVDPAEAADKANLVQSLYASVAAMQAQETSNRQRFAALADNLFLDRDSVLSQLSVLNPNIAAVMNNLYRQMIADSQTVDRSAVTLGTVTAGSANVGNGTILMTRVLDGWNAPGRNMAANIRYANIDSELAVTETMTFVCTADSYRDRVAEGQESFSWEGAPNYPPFDYRGEGSGSGPSLRGADRGNKVTNGDMEEFTSNVPTGWTLASGTAGTNVFQTTTAAQLYRGSSGLRLVGDGSTATIKLTQSLGTSFRARRMYCLSLRLKASASVSAGTFTAKLTGSGSYTSSSISVAHGSLSTSFTLYSVFIVLPAALPTDLTLELAVGSTLTNAKEVYIDDVRLNEVPYHGGVGAVVIPGSTPFVVDDRFTVSVANNDAGLIQRFFRQKYGVQLPSDDSGSETIDDALVA